MSLKTDKNRLITETTKTGKTVNESIDDKRMICTVYSMIANEDE